MRHCRWLFTVIMTATFAAALGCGDLGNRAGPGHRAQSLALTPQEELQLGTRAYREFLYKNRAAVVKYGPAVARVRRVGEKIVAAAMIQPLQREINLHFDPRFFEWEYTVFRAKEINAFCMPGGKIAVFTGLLDIVENDDQLATVLSHEISHALAHHASERLARQGVNPRGSQDDPHQRNQVMDIFAGLSGMAHDREQESEADHIGLFLMTFAGYDPHEAVKFWDRMRQATANRGHPPEILSDHPSDERRIQQMQQWVPYALAAKKAFEQGRIAPEK